MNFLTFILLLAIALFARLAMRKNQTAGEEIAALLGLMAIIGLFLVHTGIL